MGRRGLGYDARPPPGNAERPGPDRQWPMRQRPFASREGRTAHGRRWLVAVVGVARGGRSTAKSALQDRFRGGRATPPGLVLATPGYTQARPAPHRPRNRQPAWAILPMRDPAPGRMLGAGRVDRPRCRNARRRRGTMVARTAGCGEALGSGGEGGGAGATRRAALRLAGGGCRRRHVQPPRIEPVAVGASPHAGGRLGGRSGPGRQPGRERTTGGGSGAIRRPGRRPDGRNSAVSGDSHLGDGKPTGRR